MHRWPGRIFRQICKCFIAKIWVVFGFDGLCFAFEFVSPSSCYCCCCFLVLDLRFSHKIQDDEVLEMKYIA